MWKQTYYWSALLIGFLLVVLCLSCNEATTFKTGICKPSGEIRAKMPSSGHCNIEDDVCCIKGRLYTTYKCSPPVTNHTKATLILHSFEKGGDGARPSECDHQYHSDDKPVVALSTGWFNNGSRCLNYITIHWNGNSVKAMVVGECDSATGCDAKHDYLPPCANNVVVASMAVWTGLKVPIYQWGEIDIYWSDSCLTSIPFLLQRANGQRGATTWLGNFLSHFLVEVID